jgi:hypothetical protein
VDIDAIGFSHSLCEILKKRRIKMIEKYIIALQEIEKPKIADDYDLKVWQGKAINTVVRIYGTDSIQEKQIKNVIYKRNPGGSIDGYSWGGENNAEHCQKQASEIIKGLISDLKAFGLPEPKKPIQNDINISLTQHQNQTVQIHFIWESVKDELTGKQIKELEKVINSQESLTSKKIKILEKLKGFGGDVLTNIVANILTNPAIFGG